MWYNAITQRGDTYVKRPMHFISVSYTDFDGGKMFVRRLRPVFVSMHRKLCRPAAQCHSFFGMFGVKR